MAKSQALTFEEAMERIQQTIEHMENRELPLDQLLQNYEQGIKFIEFCQEKLKAAEEKVILLTQTRQGTTESTPITNIEKISDHVRESSSSSKKNQEEDDSPPALF